MLEALFDHFDHSDHTLVPYEIQIFLPIIIYLPEDPFKFLPSNGFQVLVPFIFAQCRSTMKPGLPSSFSAFGEASSELC